MRCFPSQNNFTANKIYDLIASLCVNVFIGRNWGKVVISIDICDKTCSLGKQI